MPMRRANDPCWCGSGTKFKRCHGERRALLRPPVERGAVSAIRPVPGHIDRPPYIATGDQPGRAGPQIQSPASLERMRHACQVAAEVLEETGAAVAPGVTTDELDEVAHAAYVRRGAYPSTLGYKGFPKSICTSVNGVICHGIPDDRPLRDGDIVNVDVTAYVDGMHGDTSATFVVGHAGDPIVALVETTREALRRGITAATPGSPLRDIGEAIEPFAHQRGFAVIAEYGGHGIGEVFHADPHVSHTTHGMTRELLVPGMTITIEPMLTTGQPRFATADDGWTEHTLDAMPSAQFEHTVLITDTGSEVLTVTAAGTSAGWRPSSSNGWCLAPTVTRR